MRNLIPAAALSAARASVMEMMEMQPAWAEESWQVLDPKRKANRRGQPLPIGLQLWGVLPKHQMRLKKPA